MKIKTFDIADAVIENKANELDSVTIDEEKLDILSTYCKVIDHIMDECSGKSVTVDINDNNFVEITLVLSSFVYEAKFKPRTYVELMRRAVHIRSSMSAGVTYSPRSIISRLSFAACVHE